MQAARLSPALDGATDRAAVYSQGEAYHFDRQTFAGRLMLQAPKPQQQYALPDKVPGLGTLWSQQVLATPTLNHLRLI